MNREEIRKLLGGYASGTLTEREREALCQAAMDDQELFDAMAREEPLRELLGDPAARQRLLAALDQPKLAWYKRWMPVAVAAAVAGIAGILVIQQYRERHEPVTMARRIIPPVPEAMPIPRTLSPSPVQQAPPEKTAPVRAKDASLSRLRAEQAPAVALPAAAPPPPPPPVPAAAAAPAPDARALFYAEPAGRSRLLSAAGQNRDAPKVTAAVAGGIAQLGLRYSILKSLPDGRETQVDPRAELSPGDRVVVRLAANDASFLSVLRRREDGSWDTVSSGQALARFRPYTVPPDSSLTLTEPGTIELFVLLSRSALGDPAGAMASAGRDQAVDATASDQSVYIVSTAPEQAAQRIGIPITLKYR